MIFFKLFLICTLKVKIWQKPDKFGGKYEKVGPRGVYGVCFFQLWLRGPPPGFWSGVAWRAMAKDKSPKVAKLRG